MWKNFCYLIMKFFTTKFEEDLFNQINNHFVQKDFENQINLF